MSSSTRTSPPSPPQSEASTDQVTSPHWSHRWRRWRAVVVPLTLILISALVTLWTRPTTSHTPLAIDNPGASGTMALAELLRHEGISVSKVGNTRTSGSPWPARPETSSSSAPRAVAAPWRG